MGYKDAEWAYGLDLPMREKVVLAAYALRTDDDSHETFVGQSTVTEMIGCKSDYVLRALRALESLGVIERVRRSGKGGYRTSDLVRINRSYVADSQQGSEPSRPTANKAVSGDLPSPQLPPTQPTAGAEEIIQIDHSDDHPVTPIAPATLEIVDPVDEAFERAWKHWPRKADKKTARQRFKPAIKRRGGLDDLERDIIRFGNAYRERDGGAPDFVPGLAVWLGNNRWTDDLPRPRITGRPTPTQRAAAIVQAGQNLIESRRGLAPVTTLNPKGLGS